MNFYFYFFFLVNFLLVNLAKITDRQTDRKRLLRAHCAYAQVGTIIDSPLTAHNAKIT